MAIFIRGSAERFSSFESFEATLNGEKTISFTRKSRKVVITNDSPKRDLLFKFSSAEDFGTLKPTESVTLSFRTGQVFLSANGDGAGRHHYSGSDKYFGE